jgi:hypothetical protein
MITTKDGKIVPSTGNARLDAELQGNRRIIREDMKSPDFRDSVWGFVVRMMFLTGRKLLNIYD